MLPMNVSLGGLGRALTYHIQRWVATVPPGMALARLPDDIQGTGRTSAPPAAPTALMARSTPCTAPYGPAPPRAERSFAALPYHPCEVLVES